jgi:hypothetical protein
MSKNQPKQRRNGSKPKAAANPAPADEVHLLMHLPAGSFDALAQKLKPTAPKRLHQFEAVLHFTQYSCAKVVIEAESLAEAEEQANDLCPEDIADWDPVDGDIDVASVEPVKKGGSHE